MSITVILLAAGYATRLYPLTKETPKALLPLGRGVILDEVLRSVLEVPDVSQRILVTNHRFAEPFRQWQRDRQADVRVLDDGTSTAETRLGAIRDLELARNEAGPSDDLLVVGTDNLFRWPLAEFVAQAQRHRPAPSVALWQASSPSAATQFGVVVRDASSRVIQFAEKSAQPPSAEVALCVYYFPAMMCGKIREYIDAGENTDAPGYFLAWLAHHVAVYGLMMPGVWHDIGTKEEYDTVVKTWR
ncbi:MAG: NTP transferase domain-containing protein [Candidatus Omnitrophica bacterium]|nr:NTP transferase domain-containing protein [Candidatus Omnitrophota bacterium]